MLRIRQLSPADSLEELTHLLHRAYAHLGALGLNYTAVNQSTETTSQRLAGGCCFVAEWNQQLAGTVLAKRPEHSSDCEYFARPDVATLRQFGVEPQLQGRGIGHALVNACEAWARENGYCELALDTAEPAEHLIQLYSRMGFATVGSVQWSGKVYRSVVMSKALQ
jgi:GNAT superfamily N-acetyltransferase